MCLSPRRGLPFYGPGTCSSRLRTRPLLAGDFVYEPDCRSRDGLVGEFGPKQGACFSLDRKLVGVGTSKICASVRRCVTVTRASCRTSWLWHRRAQRRQTERERLLRERQRRLGELSSIRTQHLVVESSHYPCFLTRKICLKKKKLYQNHHHTSESSTDEGDDVWKVTLLALSLQSKFTRGRSSPG